MRSKSGSMTLSQNQDSPLFYFTPVLNQQTGALPTSNSQFQLFITPNSVSGNTLMQYQIYQTFNAQGILTDIQIQIKQTLSLGSIAASSLAASQHFLLIGCSQCNNYKGGASIYNRSSLSSANGKLGQIDGASDNQMLGQDLALISSSPKGFAQFHIGSNSGGTPQSRLNFVNILRVFKNVTNATSPFTYEFSKQAIKSLVAAPQSGLLVGVYKEENLIVKYGYSRNLYGAQLCHYSKSYSSTDRSCNVCQSGLTLYLQQPSPCTSCDNFKSAVNNTPTSFQQNLYQDMCLNTQNTASQQQATSNSTNPTATQTQTNTTSSQSTTSSQNQTTNSTTNTTTSSTNNANTTNQTVNNTTTKSTNQTMTNTTSSSSNTTKTNSTQNNQTITSNSTVTNSSSKNTTANQTSTLNQTQNSSTSNSASQVNNTAVSNNTKNATSNNQTSNSSSVYGNSSQNSSSSNNTTIQNTSDGKFSDNGIDTTQPNESVNQSNGTLGMENSQSNSSDTPNNRTQIQIESEHSFISQKIMLPVIICSIGLAILIASVLIWCCLRKRSKKREQSNDDASESNKESTAAQINMKGKDHDLESRNESDKEQFGTGGPIINSLPTKMDTQIGLTCEGLRTQRIYDNDPNLDGLINIDKLINEEDVSPENGLRIPTPINQQEFNSETIRKELDKEVENIKNFFVHGPAPKETFGPDSHDLESSPSKVPPRNMQLRLSALEERKSSKKDGERISTASKQKYDRMAKDEEVASDSTQNDKQLRKLSQLRDRVKRRRQGLFADLENSGVEATDKENWGGDNHENNQPHHQIMPTISTQRTAVPDSNRQIFANDSHSKKSHQKSQRKK